MRACWLFIVRGIKAVGPQECANWLDIENVIDDALRQSMQGNINVNDIQQRQTCYAESYSSW